MLAMSQQCTIGLIIAISKVAAVLSVMFSFKKILTLQHDLDVSIYFKIFNVRYHFSQTISSYYLNTEFTKRW